MCQSAPKVLNVIITSKMNFFQISGIFWNATNKISFYYRSFTN